MLIPKRFKLYGQIIEVVMINTLDYDDNCRGQADYRNNQIKLQSPGDQICMPPTHVEQSFFHELVHYLFNAAGYDEDRKDEVKVERISNLLHQALTTAEYEPTWIGVNMGGCQCPKYPNKVIYVDGKGNCKDCGFPARPQEY